MSDDSRGKDAKTSDGSAREVLVKTCQDCPMLHWDEYNGGYRCNHPEWPSEAPLGETNTHETVPLTCPLHAAALVVKRAQETF